VIPTQLAFDVCQRWSHRRARYRPAGETIDPSRYAVEPIDDDTTARAFVTTHHYSASYPAACYRVGLFRSQPFAAPKLVGVAVFSQPIQPASIPRWTGAPPRHGLDLGRLVLVDGEDAPAMAESWFMARAFRLLRAAKPHVDAVLAYCDPVPRLDTAGRLTKPGHIGTVYAALNASYRGRARPRSLLLTPSGAVLSERALSKLRADDRGAAYTEALLRDLGAPARRLSESGADYLHRVLPPLPLRRIRTAGNHVFAWTLTEQARHLRDSWPALPRPLVPDDPLRERPWGHGSDTAPPASGEAARCRP
jgi:hypothetical protein